MKSAHVALAVLSLGVAPFVVGAPAALAQVPAPAAAEWRTPDPENLLVFDTTKGRIVVEMNPAVAPAHVERFRTLARRGFYDGLTFFRVIDEFMAQTGDPNNDGTGGSDLPDLKAEFPFRRGPVPAMAIIDRLPANFEVPSSTEVGFIGAQPVRSFPTMQMMMTADGRTPAWGLFCAGVMGAARAQSPDSANSQFFFMRQTYPSLDADYTAWGRVIAGLDVVRAIKVGEPPAPPLDVMQRVRVASDMPAAERPKVKVLDTAGPTFKAMIAAEKAKSPGRPLDPCAIEIPTKVG